MLETPPCPGFVLRHAFEPGQYLLVLGKTNAAGCSAGDAGAGPGTSGRAGDVSLRLRKVE